MKPLLLTAALEVDTEEVSSFLNTLRGLSLGSILKLILLAVVLVILVKLLLGMFSRLLEKSKLDKSLHGFLKTSVQIVLWFVAVMILAGSLHIDVTSLIAVLSVAGLALSLAIQGALSNLAGGIVILVTKPLRVGDYVVIGGDEGFVEEISMTYTKLATYDRRIVYIPNSTVTSSNVTNYTAEGKRRVDLTINASYDCGVDDVKSALLEAVKTVPTLADSEEIFARVSGYRDSAIEYTVRAWCKTDHYWTAYYDLMEAVKRSFDKNGIAMTYTNLNIHMVDKK